MLGVVTRISILMLFYCIINGELLLDQSRAIAANIAIVASEGPEQVVFRWATDKCDNDHIPDSPARAFKNAENQIIFFATHYTNQPLVGRSFDTLTPDCSHRFIAHMNPEPDKFDARIWLQTFYTEDGNTVYSIGSSDYHGTWFNVCVNAPKDNPKCWWSALVLAVSDDGGKTFTMSTPPAHVVARLPHRFSLDPGPPAGFFTSSNIIKKDGWYYTLVFTFGYKEQTRGNCLMRTKDLASTSSWSVWDGTKYSTKFISPDKPEAEHPENYRCRPVEKLQEPIRSLLWHERSSQYIAIFSTPVRFKDGDGEYVRVHFRFSTSSNLLRWSDPKDIIAFDSPHSCKKGIAAVAYPSIIDPRSNDSNFGTIQDSGFLYFTRFNAVSHCRMTMDRDLVRIPIRIQ
jgi:hypothetical protein